MSSVEALTGSLKPCSTTATLPRDSRARHGLPQDENRLLEDALEEAQSGARQVRGTGAAVGGASARSHTSLPQLRQAIVQYVEAHNDLGKPFKWSKTADEILPKVQRFGQRTQQAHRS
jgi:hypothetical protein